jgi:predicted flap endonuclease-1-like 5' DNA nuclease
MVKQTLPCAEKNCNSKMILTENAVNLLYYNCQEKHHEHTFRYTIDQKKWEKILIKTKLILNYNNDPTETSRVTITKCEKKSKEIPDQVTTKTTDLIKINGIGSKRAEELESAGVKTIADLAKRSPKYLAEKTGLPITQISSWIIEANKLQNTPSKILA